jgi:hypothetical protein
MGSPKIAFSDHGFCDRNGWYQLTVPSRRFSAMLTNRALPLSRRNKTAADPADPAPEHFTCSAIINAVDK